ncbi:PH domain-containing protein [Cutibacterium avidum]|uniref:PH domain-containing protein n=1 Tax=Cutibacterium avidum TaxID=33010 RepID=UPI003B004C29
MAWGFDDEVVVTRKGLFNRTLSIVPHARSQSVRLAQGPLQRRLGLADVYVHTSSGPVTVSCSHLDVTAARTFAIGQMDRTRAARARELSPTEHPATGVATRQELPALS